MKEFKVLAEIGNTSSKNMKVAALKRYETPALKKLLYYTYNPTLTYRVKKLDFPEIYNSVQPDISEELFMLLDELARHEVTPNQARAMIKRLMAKCTREGSVWVAKVLARDLKIGISDSTINKAFKGLIPVFKVMLAHPIIEPKSGESRWEKQKYPMGIETKEDGLRTIAICDGTKVLFCSREGNEFESLDYLSKAVMALRPGTAFVLDGEIVGSEYNPNCKVSKKNKEAGKNWIFAQGSSMTRSESGTYPEEEMRRCLEYRVWDIVDYDFFMSQGEKGACKPLKLRKAELAGIFERNEVKGIALMPNTIVNSKEEAIAFFNEIIAKGGEGAMLKDLEAPYEFCTPSNRSEYMLKIKAFYPADLRIINAGEGKPGTKYEGSLGYLVLGDDDGLVKTECGTGIDDDLRLEMWFRHKRGTLAGGIVEVLYQEITADGSLRLPIFVKERPDKTTTSLG